MLSNLSGFSILNPKKRRAFQEITGTFNVPEISFASATTSSVVTTITNYDASMTYVVSSSAGSASRVTDTVTVSGLTSNQSVTTTVAATGSSGLEFSTTTPSFPSLPDAPTLSQIDQTTSSVTVTITNYDAGLSYTIGSSAGSATRSDDEISVTGLSEGQLVTVTAIASNTSGNSAEGSIAAAAEISSSFESIATVTVGPTGTNSIQFTNIPQTYQHLHVRVLGRSAYLGNTGDFFELGFNNSVATNYSTHSIYGTGDDDFHTAIGSASYMYWSRLSTGSQLQYSFGAGFLDILDYSNTNKATTVLGIQGYDGNGNGRIYVNSGMWSLTDAITSITINFSFINNSKVSLYGVKAP